tara:strand:- start:1039 stop:1722 length:684 start_codon:yes stop_codon:yes gene_type:complete
MPIIGTTDGTGGGYTLSASGNVQGGTVINAGAIDTSVGVIKNDLALVTTADNVGETVIGSKVVTNDGTGAVTTDRAGVQKALSGGTLAFTPDKDATRSEVFVIRGVTTKLSNVALSAESSRLVGDHNDGTVKDWIYGNITSNSGNFSNANNTYNVLAVPSTDITPNFTRGSEGVAGSFTFVNPADGTDAVASEIFPSRAVPGELTYHHGAAGGPTTDEYKSREDAES